MTNKELIAKCKEYDELTKEIKEKELRQKEIQVELKKELERKKVDKMDVDIFHFSNKVTKGRTLFDTKAFAEKHPKLYKQFTKEGKSSTRFLFGLILSILVYTFFSRMFDLMLHPAMNHSTAVA